MGDYQATPPGAGFAGESCPAPTGLALIFVPIGALHFSLWLSLCSDGSLQRRVPWVRPCKCPQLMT